MKIWEITVVLLLILVNQLHSQEINLPDINGMKVSYSIKFLGKEDKKKGVKDEYQLVVTLENKTGKEFFCESSDIATITPNNSSSVFKAVTINARNTGVQTTTGAILYQIPIGFRAQEKSTFRVDEGEKPTISSRQGCLFRNIDQFSILPSASWVDGAWRQEDGQQFFNLKMLEKEIVQETGKGKIIWRLSTPGVYERVITSPTDTYRASLIFVGLDRIQYSNTDGVTVIWHKQ